jgi:ribose 1,5-bisphosphate isomerase
MFRKKRFNSIVKKIKSIKIQGARNVAKAALKAYSLLPEKSSIKILLNSRPTEPMMENVLDLISKGKQTKREILNHFKETQEVINQEAYKLIKDGDVIFTHCHSTNVVQALIYARKKGKKFEVYNTETRPLFQGRKTSKELAKSGIPVTMFVDSALGVALSESQGTKKASKVFLGSDAIISQGIINKIGSGTIAKLAKEGKIPLYILADSWKFTKKQISLEQRTLNEVWDAAPKKIKMKNPAFEFVDKKYIHGILSELGKKSFKNFLRRVS